MGSFTRKHSRFNPNITQTNEAISNHIEEIEQIYEKLNELRNGKNHIINDDPNGTIYIQPEHGMLYIKSDGAWKCITPTTIGDSDPNLNEIQNYHLHYYPTANKLRFYVKNQDTITWTELYPTSITASTDAIPVANNNNKLDKSWIARFNPIPLSQHQTEANKITLCKGDRAYLNLDGNVNDVYINIDIGEKQLFNIYAEWYDSVDGTGCYLVPFSSDYFRFSGFKSQQDQSSRTYYTNTTDRIWLGSGAKGVAVAHLTFTPWCFGIIYSSNYGTKIKNQLMAFNRYKNFTYLGSFQGGSNLKGRILIERVW